MPAKIWILPLTVEGVDIPLGKDEDQAVSIVAKGDIPLSPQTALTCEATEKSVENGPYQVTLVEKYRGEEEEVTLCEAVVKGAGNLPILVTRYRE